MVRRKAKDIQNKYINIQIKFKKIINNLLLKSDA